MESSTERRPPVDTEERLESITDWLKSNPRLTATALGVVVAFGIGGWLYTRAQAGKEMRAEQALRRAEQTVASGNAPLAQTDLQKLVRDYRGTTGAAQGAMLLAQLHFQKGEWQAAVDALEKSEAGREEFQAPVEGMLGDAYSQLNKPADAAAHYRKAAELSRFEGERDMFLADAARHLAAANDTAGALQIWQDLAKKERSELAAEARLRVGELSAKAASRS